MKRDIVSEHAHLIRYEIRDIVEVANKIQGFGIPVSWENIGDPIKKGECIPVWIKEIVRDISLKDDTYAYSDSTGVPAVREFIASIVNARGGCAIEASDIIFYNGLGDAIGRVFGHLDSRSRILVPSPSYSAISTVESAHARSAHIAYTRSPGRGWMPDPDEIESIVERDPSISCIALINPDNPTGAVYQRDILAEIVRIASDHRLFVIADETYARITYNGASMTYLSDVIGDTPAIALRSISKEYPWPGARCGWIEIHNRNKSDSFARYIESLKALKRLEVCSTTLPQVSIPLVYSDPRFASHCESRNRIFEKRSLEATRELSGIPGVSLVLPQGAFYLTVVFDKKVLTPDAVLSIDNDEVKSFINMKARGVENDKRFVYYLLASSGICVVPLSGFCSSLDGFRITLLETDADRRAWIFKTIAEKIREYISS
jgi:alanine-synthesizing transaminase